MKLFDAIHSDELKKVSKIAKSKLDVLMKEKMESMKENVFSRTEKEQT